MWVLFLGDVVGKPGRRAVREFLSRLRSHRDIDLVIANGENAAGPGRWPGNSSMRGWTC